MMAAILGTLCAVAAIAITEAFVPAGLLFLSVSEWELLAVVCYVVAVIAYLGGSGRSRTGASG